MDVLVAVHVEDSTFYKARWELLTNARKHMQRYGASFAGLTVNIQSPETSGSHGSPAASLWVFSIVATGAGSRLHGRGVAEKHGNVGGRVEGTERVHVHRTTRARAGA